MRTGTFKNSSSPLPFSMSLIWRQQRFVLEDELPYVQITAGSGKCWLVLFSWFLVPFVQQLDKKSKWDMLPHVSRFLFSWFWGNKFSTDSKQQPPFYWRDRKPSWNPTPTIPPPHLPFSDTAHFLAAEWVSFLIGPPNDLLKRSAMNEWGGVVGWYRGGGKGVTDREGRQGRRRLRLLCCSACSSSGPCHIAPLFSSMQQHHQVPALVTLGPRRSPPL